MEISRSVERKRKLGRWKLTEVDHSLRTKGLRTGSPVRCALTLCSTHPIQHAWPVQASLDCQPRFFTPYSRRSHTSARHSLDLERRRCCCFSSAFITPGTASR